MDTNSNFQSVNAAARKQPLVSPQRPDPLGSDELDWEYQGRYLELEERLLAQTERNQPRPRRVQKNPWRAGEVRRAGGARRDEEAVWTAQMPSPGTAIQQKQRFRYPRPGSGGRTGQRV